MCRSLGIAQVRRTVTLAVTVLFAVTASYIAVTYVQVASSESKAAAAIMGGDVVVVLGAAQYNGDPSPVLEARLAAALDAYQDGRVETIITTGANQPGDVFTEGFAGFRWLRNAGVPEDDIAVVVDGGNTYESLQAASRFVVPNDASVIVVTDGYHSLRAKQIAEELGLTVAVASPDSPSTLRERLRETAAIAIGRLISYRRLSSLTS